MSDCIHHQPGRCPIILCDRVPYPCEEKATWYVTFGTRDPMPRCNEHVSNSMSWSQPNTVVKIPRADHGE